MKKRLNALLISIMITVLIFISIACIGTAQSSIPKPSVPEFTVKIVSYPYDVPPTTTTTVDPYTGKETVTTQPGYRVENKSIELIIKNQPFTPHTDAEGHIINLYYNVRVKGHFEDCWRELYSIDEMMREERGAHKQGPVQSSSGYTVISCSADYPDDGQVDFQVQALAGYYTEWWPALGGPGKWNFTGQLSEWSNTQTIRMSDGTVTVSTSPNPTESPTATPAQEPAVIKDQTGAQSAVTQPSINWAEISLFAALFSVIAVLIIALMYKRKVVRKAEP